MGNLLQYTDKSTTIDNKLTSLLNQIKYDYNNGNIRTETEYYYRIKNMLSEFYDSLTKPTLKFRPAVSTPMSDEYNAMIQESCSDMEYIIKDCEALESIVSQSFADAEFSRNMMANEVSYLSKKITSIGESIARNQENGTIIFTELFNSKENIGNYTDSKACYINSRDGILMLKPKSNASPSISKIEIDEDYSNGFPGNTHCVDTLNNEMHFIGNEGLRINPNKMIDGNTDTWFEFELFEITDNTRKQCNSYGFEFDEGVSWISNDGILKLKIKATIDNPSVCSWISIVPYLSDVKGIKACYLEKCEVVTTNNNVYEISRPQSFEDTIVFPFPPYTVKEIYFTFTQTSKYLTKIGHFYYTETNTSNMSIFQNYDNTDMFARIDGPKPSISLLGCKYNPETQWITYPTNKTEFADDTYITSKLFKMPENFIDKKANYEIIDAYRYMLGIREIYLSSYSFSDYGEYVSINYTTEEPITSISLEADEYIPGDNTNILRYYITLDNGITWYPIYPMHRAYEGIYKYYVNNDIIENMLAFDNTKKKSKNLSIVGDCTNVKLKIEMELPDIENNTSTTPIVYGYKLKLTTGGETIEY